MANKEMEFDLNKLTDEQLVELFQLDKELFLSQQEDVLSRLLETAIMISAKKGRGKTLSAVALSHESRERFGRNVITVGSKMGLKPPFGPFQVMNEVDFRDELERINVAANEEENAEQVANAFKKYGISILYSTLVFDEAYKLFESRRATDKLVQLFGYFMAQSRHYHVTTILLTPDEDMIDKRVRRQMDWKGRVYHNKYTDTARLRLVQGLEVLTLDIDGKDPTLHVPYYEMYDSWAMLGYRPTSLNLNNV